MTDDSEEINSQSFSVGGHCEQSWHGQGCPLFDVVHPAFPLLTTASSTRQGALKDGFGESVVACDMPEPCKFPSLVSVNNTHTTIFTFYFAVLRWSKTLDGGELVRTYFKECLLLRKYNIKTQFIE